MHLSMEGVLETQGVSTVSNGFTLMISVCEPYGFALMCMLFVLLFYPPTDTLSFSTLRYPKSYVRCEPNS